MIGYGLTRIQQIKIFAQAVCDVLGGGEAAVRLLCETAAAETQCGTVVDRTPFGAGSGLCQCDELPYADTVNRAKQSDLDAIKKAFGIDLKLVSWSHVNYSPLLSLIVCRLHYKLRPGFIPLTSRGRAEYWKKHYNSVLGKGTVDHYLVSAARFEIYF